MNVSLYTATISTLLFASTASAGLITAGDFLEAEGNALDNFEASVQVNLWDIQTAISALGGSYSISGFGVTIGDNLFAAGNELQPVPEPSSLALFGLGLLTMTGYGWRHRKTCCA